MTIIQTNIKLEGIVFDFGASQVMLKQVLGQHHICEFIIQLNTVSKLSSQPMDWIGKRLFVAFEEKDVLQEKKPVFEGLVTDIRLIQAQNGHSIAVRAQSPTIALDAGVQIRSFAHRTLDEIVHEVLRPYEKSFSKTPKIEAGFKDTIEYIVQYEESDWRFLSRIAARYGEYLYYDGGQLYFVNTPLDLNAITLPANAQWECGLQAQPKGFQLSAYDYRKHKPVTLKADFGPDTGINPLAKQVIDASAKGIYPHHPASYVSHTLDEKELQHLVDHREQAIVNQLVVLKGSTNCADLRLGNAVQIKQESLFTEADGKYRITKLTHTLDQSGNYRNQFEAVPCSLMAPPSQVAPYPPLCEEQLGTIAQIDDDQKMGRVKVRLGWQEQVSNEDLPWVRVASPFVGADKGMYFLPDIGDQVLVGFEEGNVEKPYVLTSFFHAEAKPMHHHPQNHDKGFWSSANKILFRDKKGSECIDIKSNSYINIQAGKQLRLHANEAIEITTGEKGNVILNAGKGSITIIAKQVSIEGQENEKIIIEKTITIQVNNNKIIMSESSTTMGGATDLNCKGDTINLDGNTIKITGTRKLDMKSSDIVMN